ncbi:hypothetical protein [Agreia sp. COWG]|uniref:hypothetical protein n=1 Tax=Agreia sp. COWG TaxID=2773266 RepID=UPI00192666E5|nr:hypothetical protein [Agreia sp. COWG]CAD6007010.1 conserved protein of unknown function [Agreia sp. COWG]
MALSEQFDVTKHDDAPWEVLYVGTPNIAGHLTPEGSGFRLHDSVDNDLGLFGTVEHALTVLYGSD